MNKETALMTVWRKMNLAHLYMKLLKQSNRWLDRWVEY